MTSAADAALITRSLEIAAEHGGDLTAAVYARLFRERPDLEGLFSLDTDGAVRGEMLARAFDAILDYVGPRTYARTLIFAEATTHEGYAVPREAFAAFFQIIADTVRDACGALWSADMSAAWNHLTDELSRVIGE